MFIKVADELIKAAGRELDIRVEYEEAVAFRCVEGAIVPLAETNVRRIRDEAHATGEWPDARKGVIIACVVENDNVEGKLRRSQEMFRQAAITGPSGKSQCLR